MDQRKTCKSQRCNFLLLYAKHIEKHGTYEIFQGLTEIRRESTLREQQSPNCAWQRDSRGARITLQCYSLYHFGIYVKQISSALTRPTGTWLEPASLALPWLAPPQQITDPTRVSTGDGWVCALTCRTACKNDTLPFTRSQKKSVFNMAKFTGEKWNYLCWSLTHPHNVLTSWLQLIVPGFLSQWNMMGLWENNLVCFFFFPRHYNLMAYFSPGVGSVTANTEHSTHSLHTVLPKIFAPTLSLTLLNIIIIIIWK